MWSACEEIVTGDLISARWILAFAANIPPARILGKERVAKLIACHTVGVAAPRSSALARAPRLSVGEVRYLVFGRVLPAVFFAFLGLTIWSGFAASVRETIGHTSNVGAIAGGPVRRGLYLLFVLIPVAIYVVRPRPQARDGSIPARAAAFVGTTMLLVFGIIVDQPHDPTLFRLPDVAVEFVDVLLAASTGLAVYGLLHLRRSFSIVPEARRLVQTGPYRWVRHPLYLAEISTAVCLELPQPRLWSALILLPFICIQLLRTVYEERLLRAHFPEYREYAAKTRRLIPFVV